METSKSAFGPLRTCYLCKDRQPDKKLGFCRLTLWESKRRTKAAASTKPRICANCALADRERVA